MKRHTPIMIIGLLINTILIAEEISREEKNALDIKSTAEMQIQQIDAGIEARKAAIAAKERSIDDSFAKEEKLAQLANKSKAPNKYHLAREQAANQTQKLQGERRQLQATVTRMSGDKEKYIRQIRNSDEIISRIRNKEEASGIHRSRP